MLGANLIWPLPAYMANNSKILLVILSFLLRNFAAWAFWKIYTATSFYFHWIINGWIFCMQIILMMMTSKRKNPSTNFLFIKFAHSCQQHPYIPPHLPDEYSWQVLKEDFEKVSKPTSSERVIFPPPKTQDSTHLGISLRIETKQWDEAKCKQ